LAVKLSNNFDVLESLYNIIRQNPGNRPLKITIVSKLHNVVIDSAIHVNSQLTAALEGNEYVDIIA